MRRPNEDFPKFCECLKQTNQEWVVKEYLNPNMPYRAPALNNGKPQRNDVTDEASGVNTTVVCPSWKRLLVRNHSELVDNLDPNDEVIMKLVDADIMNLQCMEICKELPNPWDKTQYILDHMQRRNADEFLKFCGILKACGQEHIVDDYLTAEVLVGGIQEAIGAELRQEDYHTQPEDQDVCQTKQKESFYEERTAVQPVQDTENKTYLITRYHKETLIKEEQIVHSNKDLHRAGIAGSDDGRQPELEKQQTRGSPAPLERDTGETVEKTRSLKESIDEKSLKYPTQASEPSEPIEPHVSGERSVTPPPVPVSDESNNPTNNDSVRVPRRQAPEPMRKNVHMQKTVSEPAFTEGPNRPIEIEHVRVKHCNEEFYSANKNRSYSMSKPVRGQCIIINIHKVVGADDRNGTEVDGNLLTQLFEQLHFKVTELKNLTAQQIKDEMRTVSRDASLAHTQCLVLFFLSHGEQVNQNNRIVDCILGRDGGRVYIDEDVLNVFTADSCPQLRSKPKLVFLQACRGVHYDSADVVAMTETDGRPKSYRDFLILYPTQGDFRSFRNTLFGSWYVNAIVRVFMERAHNTGLCQLMNAVNALMSSWTSSTRDKESHGKTQVAQVLSNFTKEDLFFFPGICRSDD